MSTRFRNGHPDAETHIPDGVYMELKEFAVEHDLPEETVRTWVKRRQVPAVNYYGRIFIPEKCDYASLRYGKKPL